MRRKALALAGRARGRSRRRRIVLGRRLGERERQELQAHLGNYYGVTHPSQPNYIAATAGTTQGVPNDNDVTVNLPNIVNQLETKNHSWKAYMQSLSLCNGKKLASACGNQLYERKHDPFVPSPTSSRTRRGWTRSLT